MADKTTVGARFKAEDMKRIDAYRASRPEPPSRMRAVETLALAMLAIVEESAKNERAPKRGKRGAS